MKTPPLPPDCKPLAVLQPLMTDHFIACHYRCAWLDEAYRQRELGRKPGNCIFAVWGWPDAALTADANAAAWAAWGRGEWKGEVDGH